MYGDGYFFVNGIRGADRSLREPAARRAPPYTRRKSTRSPASPCPTPRCLPSSTVPAAGTRRRCGTRRPRRRKRILHRLRHTKGRRFLAPVRLEGVRIEVDLQPHAVDLIVLRGAGGPA